MGPESPEQGWCGFKFAEGQGCVLEPGQVES